MEQFNYGNIGDMKKFSAEDYPILSAELNQVIKDIHHTPIYFKSDIIISYLKDHSLKQEWIDANPVLAKLITSGTLITKHLEQLFEACRWNRPFRSDFERHLKTKLN